MVCLIYFLIETTVQHSTVQYSTVQYSTIQYSTVVQKCSADVFYWAGENRMVCKWPIIVENALKHFAIIITITEYFY